eukprot:scaffold229614_cov28-Tisochrysis_lutea.AAC.5
MGKTRWDPTVYYDSSKCTSSAPTFSQWRTSIVLATCAIAAAPIAAITLGSPNTWSPCMCEMKILVVERGGMPARTICSCVVSPQSNSHVSPPSRKATDC